MTADTLRDVPVLRMEQCAPEISGVAVAAYLAPDQLRQAATRLLEREFFLEDISMVEVAEGFLGVYHFDHFQTPGRIVLRVFIPKDASTIPTISDIYQGASWHERECRDFFGVVFAGHDNLIPLLLTAEDVHFHPLRKSDKSLKSFSDLVPAGTGGPQAGDVAAFLSSTAGKTDDPESEGTGDGQESASIAAA